MTKSTYQRKTLTNEDKKKYFTIFLRAVLHKESIGKNDRNLGRFNTISQRLTEQVRTILKKGWFSDLEIREIYKLIKSEKYEQNSPA